MRGRLLAIVQHDVRRLDRLISDISDASRLDAELARADAEPVDMARLLEAVVSIANERRRETTPRIASRSSRRPTAEDAFFVLGHDSRLARCSATSSTMPARSRRRTAPCGLRCGAAPAQIEVVVDDDGPGIRPHALERIFERFYTDRPDQGFGQNQASACRSRARSSRRTGGTSGPRTGSGRRAPTASRAVLGARFIVRLPPLG